MNFELVWFLSPICAILYQLGGTYNKLIRRVGIPSVITLASIFVKGWAWSDLLLWPAIFGVLSLPFTIGKGDVRKWYQFAWIWVLGYLLGAPCFLISFSPSSFYFALFPCVMLGITGTLSNIPKTASLFPWKFVEGITGFFMATSYCLALN
jgi:hypothetical protein